MGAFERAERPILPPLHSLGLPNPSLGTAHVYDNTLCPPLHIPQWPQRQVSPLSSSSRSSSPALFDISSPPSRASTPSTEPDGSSTSTPLSAPPTPILSISPLPARAPADPTAPPMRFRLEPCTLAEAQAVVLVPPPHAPFIPSSSMPHPPQTQQALLLLGNSIEHFRKPDRQLTKGARLHPYRIVPSQRKDGAVGLPKTATL